MFDISASWVDQTINMLNITDLWITETILVQKRGPETHIRCDNSIIDAENSVSMDCRRQRKMPDTTPNSDELKNFYGALVSTGCRFFLDGHNHKKG